MFQHQTIQEKDLPIWNSQRRVLGVIRPTVEMVGDITKTGHIGVLGTIGTIQSGSYPIEINKLYPYIIVSGQACPLWVPLVENSESHSEGDDFFVRKYLDALIKHDKLIDTIILGCTHYPILLPKIKKYLDENINVISKGEIVAKSLKNYLSRHLEMKEMITRNGKCRFLTTESVEKFQKSASIFLQEDIAVERIQLLEDRKSVV